LQVGDRVQIAPNHSCPVANLASGMVALGVGCALGPAAGGTYAGKTAAWRVHARGAVQ
jgi:hypothetical protein